MDDRQHDDAERGLQLALLVELVQQHLGVFVALDLDYDAHPLTVGFVADLGDPFDLLLLDQLGDFLDQAGLVDLVGKLRDNNRLALGAFGRLDMSLGAHLDDAPPGGIGIADPLTAVNRGAGGKVRPGNHRQQLLEGHLRVVDNGDDTVNYFTQVMGRYVGGHADRDTGRTVDQQVGELGRQNRRLQHFVVVVGRHVDGFFVQVGQQFVGEMAQADLGVTHGGRPVAVHRSEVPLSVNQHVAQRKILGHAHDRIVGGGIAMWMVLTDNITDHTGRFLVGLVVVVAHVVHGVQAAAMDRFETVAHVRQRPADDDRHGVIHVRALHLVFDVDRYLVDWGFCWGLH